MVIFLISITDKNIEAERLSTLSFITLARKSKTWIRTALVFSDPEVHVISATPDSPRCRERLVLQHGLICMTMMGKDK